MKVYLLMWDGGYDGYGNPFIFSSKEKAIEYFNTLDGLSKKEYIIVEKEVDVGEDTLNDVMWRADENFS